MAQSELPNFDKLWNYQKPDETEQKFKELLPQAKISGNADYHAQLLTQIARTQGLQRQFETAHETLNGVEKMLEAQDLPMAQIRYFLERGRVYNSSGKKAEARPFFLEAMAKGETEGADYYTVDAAHMMAIIAPPAKQIEWNERAMSIAEQSKDKRARAWLGSLYNNLGWSYHGLKEYQKALYVFQKALKWQEQHGQLRNIRIARWCIARAYRSLNQLDKALELQRALLKDNEADNGSTNSYVFEEIAECLYALDKPEEAKPYFQKAYDMLSQDAWLVANEAARLERLKELGT